MIDRLELLEKHFEQVDSLIGQPEVATNPLRLQELAQERASIESLVARYREYKAVTEELNKTKAMLDDGLGEELVALVKEEVSDLKSRQSILLQELQLALLPRDANDNRDVIIEIRAGTGGEAQWRYVPPSAGSASRKTARCDD